MEGSGRREGREEYKLNTTALFSWIFLLKKNPTLMCTYNRVNENKAGFWIFSACDVLGEGWHYAYNERNAQKD